MEYMTEIAPSVWVSSNSSINDKVLWGKNITIYGNTTICKKTIIEDNVIIGHPSPKEVENLYFNQNVNLWKNSLSDAYNNVSIKHTHVGKNSIIRSNTTIYSGNFIDEHFDCGHNVIIREDCNISKCCYLFTNTQIKRNVIIGQNCRIAGTIADRTKIGAYTTMLGHTVHKYNVGIGGRIEGAPTIGDGVIIGRESVIVGSIFVGDFSLIATNAVVLNDVEAFTVAAGIPAMYVKNRKHEDLVDILEKMRGDGYECKTRSFGS